MGTGRGTSVTELITVLAGLAGLPGRFEVDPDRMRADDGHVSDPARLMSEVGWRPHVELRDGLAWLVEDVR